MVNPHAIQLLSSVAIIGNVFDLLYKKWTLRFMMEWLNLTNVKVLLIEFDVLVKNPMRNSDIIKLYL